MTRVMIASLALASTALAASIDSQRETPGRRFCEVAWKTAESCESRLVLQDGESECVVRPSRPGPAREHAVMVPLVKGRPLSYCVLLPDGSRTPPRRLPEASDERRGALKARQEPAAGGLDVLASSSADARFSLSARRGGKDVLLGARDELSPAARFHISGLGPDERLTDAALRATHLDLTETLLLGSILGNRALATDFVKAVEKLDLRSLMARMYTRGATRELIRSHYRERAKSSGLEAIGDAAVTRLAGVLSDGAVDGAKLRVPFAYHVYRLASLDWLAQLKGWDPISGAAAELAGAMRIWHPDQPPASAVSVYAQNQPFPVLLWMWPDFIPQGPETVTWARVNDRAWRDALSEEIRDKLMVLERAFGFVVTGIPVNWGEFRIEPSMLGSGDGLVTFYADVNNVEPAYLLYLRLNDEVLIPFRNTEKSFKGLPILDPGPDVWRDRVKAKANWIACTTSARLLKPGRVNWIALTQNLLPSKVAPAVPALRELRIGPGGGK